MRWRGRRLPQLQVCAAWSEVRERGERSRSSQRVGAPQVALPLHQVLLEGDPPCCTPHNYSPGLVPSLPWGLAGKLRTQKHADNIYVHFNNTDVGYHSSADTELIIENLSQTSSIRILCVKINGADMEYNHKMDTVLQVGEKYVIDISDVSLESAEKPFTVAVTCLIDNTMHTLAVKEFDFIAMSDDEMKIYSQFFRLIENLHYLCIL